MAPYPSTLAWKIPWAEEPGGLQSMGSRRVGHDLSTKPPQREKILKSTREKRQITYKGIPRF